MNSSRQTNGDQARCNQDPDQVTIAHFHDLVIRDKVREHPGGVSTR